MKSDKIKKLLLEQLKKTPIIQIAVEKVGVGKSSFYRWKEEDKEFAKAVDEALIEGESLINDLSETQLINLIREKNFQAIRMWLQVHSKKYNPKIEVTGSFNVKEESLTPEQQATVKEALRLASLDVDPGMKEINKINNQNGNEQQHSIAETSGTDVQRS